MKYFYQVPEEKRIKLSRNKKFMLAAVKVNGWMIEFLSDEMREDKEIIKAAVKSIGANAVSNQLLYLKS